MRAFTGRDKIIKFEGCYHGHADMFLVKAGSGVATLGLPDSPEYLVYHQQYPNRTPSMTWKLLKRCLRKTAMRLPV